MVFVFYEFGSRAADLLKVKGADIRRHADRYSLIRGNEDIRESYGKKFGFFRRRVVVIDKIDDVFIYVGENFLAERVEFRLGIS